MDSFLDADCVINALFDKGVLTRKLWKQNRRTASSYDVIFEFKNSARIAGFTVYIREDYHCIGLTALVNQSRRFKIPIDDIVVKCAIR